MPFCPQCGYEYIEGKTTCPDCGRALTAQPPEQPGSTTAGWPPVDTPAPPLTPQEEKQFSAEASATVFEAPDAAMSQAVKETLEEAGIPVMEDVYQHPLTSEGLRLGLPGSYSRLITLESRAEEAKRIIEGFLAAYQAGNLALTREEATEAGPEPAQQPHRGTTVLVLGIVGLALWPFYIGLIPALFAWIMGNRDLDSMKRGTMDAKGQGFTQAGRICGMVVVLLLALGIVFNLLRFAFAVLSLSLFR